MEEAVPFHEVLQFFYFGFHSTLVRYRALTLLGWLASALGAAGFFLSWYGPYETLSIALSISTAVSGIALVHQSVSALDVYVRVPFPVPPEMPGNLQEAVAQCARLMEDVHRGGWQEAYGALRELKTMADRFGLPPIP